MKPIKRGCGERDAGNIYGMCPTSPTGTPVWNFLLDPPLPYHEGQFRGIKFAQDEVLGDGWGNGSILLMDWIGAGAYPSVACWAEETRFWGMSRKFPASFPFERLAGKKVWLAVVHNRAIHEWDREPVPGPTYMNCRKKGEEHYPVCVHHCWATAPAVHGTAVPFDEYEGSLVPMPWPQSERGGFYAWHDLAPRNGPYTPQGLFDDVASLPEHIFAPGVFGVFPISHFEAIKYLPDGCKVDKSGLDVRVVAE